MSGFFEICDTNIRLDTVKNYRIIQREYIYRPIYREVTTVNMKIYTDTKFVFVNMIPYAAIIDENEYKAALSSMNNNSIVDGNQNPAEFVANIVMAPITFVGDVVGNVFNTIGGWFNWDNRPKYHCLNLSGRVFETYLDDIPIVVVKSDGQYSDVYKNDDMYYRIIEPAKPTIQQVDVLLIEADRRYLFFGNGIQTENVKADYNRLKNMLNTFNASKK